MLDIAEATRSSRSGSTPERDQPARHQALLAVARGYAATVGRSYVMPDDVQAVANAVLAHRLQGESTAGLGRASAAVAEMLTSVAIPSV